MSLINGDKARSGRARRKKIAQRLRNRALRKTLKTVTKAASPPAGSPAKASH